MREWLRNLVAARARWDIATAEEFEVLALSVLDQMVWWLMVMAAGSLLLYVPSLFVAYIAARSSNRQAASKDREVRRMLISLSKQAERIRNLESANRELLKAAESALTATFEVTHRQLGTQKKLARVRQLKGA